MGFAYGCKGEAEFWHGVVTSFTPNFSHKNSNHLASLSLMLVAARVGGAEGRATIITYSGHKLRLFKAVTQLGLCSVRYMSVVVYFRQISSNLHCDCCSSDKLLFITD